MDRIHSESKLGKAYLYAHGIWRSFGRKLPPNISETNRCSICWTMIGAYALVAVLLGGAVLFVFEIVTTIFEYGMRPGFFFAVLYILMLICCLGFFAGGVTLLVVAAASIRELYFSKQEWEDATKRSKIRLLYNSFKKRYCYPVTIEGSPRFVAPTYFPDAKEWMMGASFLLGLYVLILFSEQVRESNATKWIATCTPTGRIDKEGSLMSMEVACTRQGLQQVQFALPSTLVEVIDVKKKPLVCRMRADEVACDIAYKLPAR